MAEIHYRTDSLFPFYLKYFNFNHKKLRCLLLIWEIDIKLIDRLKCLVGGKKYTVLQPNICPEMEAHILQPEENSWLAAAAAASALNLQSSPWDDMLWPAENHNMTQQQNLCLFPRGHDVLIFLLSLQSMSNEGQSWLQLLIKHYNVCVMEIMWQIRKRLSWSVMALNNFLSNPDWSHMWNIMVQK